MPLDDNERAAVSISQHRLLAVEHKADENTIEIRRISERQAVQNETLKNVNENVRETKEAVESLKGDRYKYLVGFVLTIGSVLLTYFLDHSDAIARTTGH